MKRLFFISAFILFLTSIVWCSQPNQLIGGSSQTIHEPPIKLLKKGAWLIELTESGGFGYRFHQFAVSSDAQFTVLSRSPITTFKIKPETFSQVAILVPSVFEVKIPTNTFSETCFDCIKTRVRVWKIQSQGNRVMTEQSWNEGTGHKVAPVFTELSEIITSLQKAGQ